MQAAPEHLERRPPPALRPLVATCSGYRDSSGRPGRHRGLPSPYLTLIVTLDEPLLLEGADGPRRFDALAGGLHTTPTYVLDPGRQSGIQLGLTPLGARALLGVPAAELAGRDVPAGDVLGPSVAELRERLLAAGSWDERFAVLGGWLRATADPTAALAPEVAHAWHLLTGSGAGRSVAQVAEAVGWGERHLRARLRTEVGLAPRTAARVARFDRARRALQRQVAAGRPTGLAGLAADHGYADQAHLTREFRDLGGCSPTTWVAQELRNVQAGEGAALPGSRHEH